MIYNYIIVGAVVLIFIILLRRIPQAKKLTRNDIPDINSKEMTKFSIVNQANEAFDQKEFEKAEKLYIQAAAADPRDDKIFSRLGVIYLEQNNYYDAKEALLQAVKLDSSNPPRHVNLGLAYMGLKDYYKASKSFKDAIRLDPRNSKYKKLLERADKFYEKDRRRTVR